MSVKALFKRYEDRKWLLIAPGGNQGDDMIYAGARKLAQKADLDFTEIKLGRNRKNIPDIETTTIIYIQGGGGWCTWWNWTPRLVNMLAEKYPNNDMVIGPSTVAKQDWYIDKWLPDKRLLFYARENTTYDYMKDRNVKILRDHDTALCLTEWDEWLSPLLECEKTDRFKLAAIREDPESSNTLPESVDLGDYDLMVDPCLTKNWAQLHVYASEILTNRSHSAILGAILGKKTKMFRGSYHKNRSVWEYSLKSRGVKWIAV